MCFAPSAPRLLESKLPAGDEKQTSAAADSGKTMRGGVLEGLEGLVRLETLRKVLSGFGIETVATQTASESQKQTSGAADSREWAEKEIGVLQRLERRCRRHKVAQYDRPGHTDALVVQI